MEFRDVLKYIIYHWKGFNSSIDKVTLPAFIFHAITGADNTGSLPGNGKVSCWKAFLEADDSIRNADWLNLVERSNLVLASKIELKDLSANYTYQGRRYNNC